MSSSALGAACAALLTMCATTACVYLPRTATVYNSDCGIYERQMTLQVYQIGTMTACRDEGCAAVLALFGAVSAASVVVSGSVVVVGNVVTWLERQGNCVRPEDRGVLQGPAPPL